MIKKAVQIGNPIIRQKSKSVTNFKQAEKIVKDLTDSMRHYSLVGMAAPQIGVSLRIFVSEIKQTKYRKTKSKEALRVFINPKIVSASKQETVLYEGCGSVDFANIFGPVKRPKSVEIIAYDLAGKKFTLKATGLLAKVIQHEMDHLNGICCIDKFTDTRKIMQKEEYLKK